jgi:hypothetical protein
MTDIYGDGDDMDGEKPTWDDDIDIADIANIDINDMEPLAGSSSSTKKDKKKKDKKKKKKDGAGDDGGVDLDNMDADAQPMQDDEEWDGTEEMRKRVLEKYMDEISGLEFNDLVSIPRVLPQSSCTDYSSLGRRHAHPIQIRHRAPRALRTLPCRDSASERRRAQQLRRAPAVRTV